MNGGTLPRRSPVAHGDIEVAVSPEAEVVHVVEAVRQIRGSSTAQVDDAELALVASGAGGPADGLILRR